MYKSFKVTKRYSFAIERFRKSAKKVHKVYRTGIHRTHDELNGFRTIFFTLGRSRLMIYIKDKNPMGHCSG